MKMCSFVLRSSGQVDCYRWHPDSRNYRIAGSPNRRGTHFDRIVRCCRAIQRDSDNPGSQRWRGAIRGGEERSQGWSDRRWRGAIRDGGEHWHWAGDWECWCVEVREDLVSLQGPSRLGRHRTWTCLGSPKSSRALCQVARDSPSVSNRLTRRRWRPYLPKQTDGESALPTYDRPSQLGPFLRSPESGPYCSQAQRHAQSGYIGALPISALRTQPGTTHVPASCRPTPQATLLVHSDR